MSDKKSNNEEFKVLLDTNIFESACFDFNSGKLGNIKELANNELIILLQSEIIEKEITGHINNYYKQAFNHLKRPFKLDKKNDGTKEDKYNQKVVNSIITNNNIENTVQKIISDAKDRKLKEFDNFNKDCNMQYIPYNNTSSEKIFNDYFNIKPPFGEGKKRKEFADAFILNSLVEFLNGEECHIVSNDSDWEEFTKINSNLKIYKKLSDFSDFINKTSYAVIVKNIITYIPKHENEIILKIKNELTGINLFGDFDDIAEENIELEEETIDIKLYNDSLRVIEINEDKQICKLEATCNIKFTVNVTGYDANSWHYDSEEKEVFYLGDPISIEMEQDLEETVLITCSYQVKDIIIKNVTFSTIDIQIEDNDYDKGDYGCYK